MTEARRVYPAGYSLIASSPVDLIDYLLKFSEAKGDSMVERLSYTDFKSELLVAIAVAVEGDLDTDFLVNDVAKTIDGRFPNSWIPEAVRELARERLIGDVLLGTHGDAHHLTGSGLRAAETAANERGSDIYELMDEAEERGPFHVDATAIVEAAPITIDRSSEAFKQLDEALRERIRELKGDNELIAEGGAEVSQRLAELEAGNRLLQADQADAGLIRRLLLPSLAWFAKKARDEATSQLIKKLIALVLDFLP